MNESKYSYSGINEMRNKCRSTFLEYYETSDFIKYTPFPLRIDFDPSLSFVNCSICHFKKAYYDEVKLEAYCVSQPALRTNTYKDFFEGKSLMYTGAIEMLGAFSPIDINNTKKDILDKHFSMQADFLTMILGEEAYINVEVSPFMYEVLLPNTIDYLRDKGIEVIKSKKNLQWKYGIDGIEGIGSNWIISKNKQKCEFGNVILLKKNDKYIGVESGGAVEALLRVFFGFGHKIFANYYCNDKVCSRIFEDRPYTIEYFDAISIIADILWYYSELKLNMKGILEKYIKIVKCAIIMGDICEETFRTDVKQIELTHKFWSTYPDQLYLKIKSLVTRIWDLDIVVQNAMKNKRKKMRGYSEYEIIAISKCFTNGVNALLRI